MSLSDKLFVASQYLVPQHGLSRMAGLLAENRNPAVKNAFTRWFVKQFGVNLQEAQRESVDDYVCFNDFFTRELKPGVRNLTAQPGEILCPVDGAVSEAGSIEFGRLIQAKGRSYSLTDLLGGDPERATPFLGGLFSTIYLSPKDYHRIHMPVDGDLREMVFVPGKLFSVNPTTANSVSNLFARNERVVCIFDSAHGPFAMVLVGAMIVASVETVWAGRVAPQGGDVRSTRYEPGTVTLKAGQEMGRFHLGSTVVLVFPEKTAAWTDLMTAGRGVRLGEIAGHYRG